MNTEKISLTSGAITEMARADLKVIESNPELLKQLALCAFYAGFCQKWRIPVDNHLWRFVARGDDGNPIHNQLDEARLRQCFLDFWDQWLWGEPVLHSDRRGMAERYLALGCPDLPRELVGMDFVYTLAQGGRNGYFSMDDDAVRTIKAQIRKRYAIERANLSELLDINGSEEVVSATGKRITSILA